jgi:hypothetical protein
MNTCEPLGMAFEERRQTQRAIRRLWRHVFGDTLLRWRPHGMLPLFEVFMELLIQRHSSVFRRVDRGNDPY